MRRGELVSSETVVALLRRRMRAFPGRRLRTLTLTLNLTLTSTPTLILTLTLTLTLTPTPTLTLTLSLTLTVQRRPSQLSHPSGAIRRAS